MLTVTCLLTVNVVIDHWRTFLRGLVNGFSFAVLNLHWICVKSLLDHRRTFSWVLVNTFGYFSCGAMKTVKVELVLDCLDIAVPKFDVRIELGLVVTNWASCGKLHRTTAK